MGKNEEKQILEYKDGQFIAIVSQFLLSFLYYCFSYFSLSLPPPLASSFPTFIPYYETHLSYLTLQIQQFSLPLFFTFPLYFYFYIIIKVHLHPICFPLITHVRFFSSPFFFSLRLHLYCSFFLFCCLYFQVNVFFSLPFSSICFPQ